MTKKSPPWNLGSFLKRGYARAKGLFGFSEGPKLIESDRDAPVVEGAVLPEEEEIAQPDLTGQPPNSECTAADFTRPIVTTKRQEREPDDLDGPVGAQPEDPNLDHNESPKGIETQPNGTKPTSPDGAPKPSQTNPPTGPDGGQSLASSIAIAQGRVLPKAYVPDIPHHNRFAGKLQDIGKSCEMIGGQLAIAQICKNLSISISWSDSRVSDPAFFMALAKELGGYKPSRDEDLSVVIQALSKRGLSVRKFDGLPY